MTPVERAERRQPARLDALALGCVDIPQGAVDQRYQRRQLTAHGEAQLVGVQTAVSTYFQVVQAQLFNQVSGGDQVAHVGVGPSLRHRLQCRGAAVHQQET